MLNLDVAGLVPTHRMRASCEALVRAARYAPDGERGACPIVRRAWTPVGWNRIRSGGGCLNSNWKCGAAISVTIAA
jgi:hypothetical protein